MVNDTDFSFPTAPRSLPYRLQAPPIVVAAVVGCSPAHRTCCSRYCSPVAVARPVRSLHRTPSVAAVVVVAVVVVAVAVVVVVAAVAVAIVVAVVVVVAVAAAVAAAVVESSGSNDLL